MQMIIMIKIIVGEFLWYFRRLMHSSLAKLSKAFESKNRCPKIKFVCTDKHLSQC